MANNGALKNLEQVPVVIFCGGLGTRMREDGEIRPKPMIEVGEKPVLWHIMKMYASHGFRRFILPLGFRGDYIKNYFYNYRLTSADFTLVLNPDHEPTIHSRNAESQWEITFVDTGVKTMKGGRLKRIENHLKSDVFHVTYGDGVGDINLTALHSFHLRHGKVGTVSVVRPPSRFGEMVLKGTEVRRFEEKPQLSTGGINGGFFVFNRELLGLLSKDEDCDLEFGALQKLAEKRQLRAYRHQGFWQCMDTPRDRDYLNKLWDEGAPWKTW